MANLLQRSRLTVHALLNLRMKAEMYSTVAAVVSVGRLWFHPAPRATSRRKLKVATASHSAVHSVTTPASTPSPVACRGLLSRRLLTTPAMDTHSSMRPPANVHHITHQD